MKKLINPIYLSTLKPKKTAGKIIATLWLVMNLAFSVYALFWLLLFCFALYGNLSMKQLEVDPTRSSALAILGVVVGWPTLLIVSNIIGRSIYRMWE